MGARNVSSLPRSFKLLIFDQEPKTNGFNGFPKHLREQGEADLARVFPGTVQSGCALRNFLEISYNLYFRLAGFC
jgi:hypothetical protein